MWYNSENVLVIGINIMYAHISPGCNGSGLIQEAKDLDFRILQGSHHRWLLCDTDISFLRQRNTVIGKYSVQWERNTLYCEREILYTVIGKYSIQWERNTSYCKREILCIVREKYFVLSERNTLSPLLHPICQYGKQEVRNSAITFILATAENNSGPTITKKLDKEALALIRTPNIAKTTIGCHL